MRGTRTWGCTLGAAILAVTVGACGGTDLGRADAAELNQYHESDLEFFQPLHWGGALEPEWFETLEDAARSADAIVVAEVVDVRHVRTTMGPLPNDTTYGLGIDLRPVELVLGELDDEYSQQLSVGRGGFVGPNIDQIVEEERANLPKGLSVWFLRDMPEYHTQMKGEEPPEEEYKEARFRLVSSQGLFAQGEQSVANPIRNPDPVVAKARSFRQLSGLVNHLRSVDGWIGRAEDPS